MDAILFWNDVALEANRVSHSNGMKEQTGPPLSARALAIVHLAMYDAFAGASGNPPNLPPYQALTTAARAGASVDEAVAAAAHATLSALFPGQRAFFDVKYGQAGSASPAPGFWDGRAFGLAVAKQLLDARRNDPDASDVGYVPSMARGHHRADPDNPLQGFHAPFYGARTRCFASARHGLNKPPAVDVNPASEYRRALHEVRGKGIAPHLLATVPLARRRTADETLIGLFWAYDGAFELGTPPRFYNQIIREIAVAKGNTAADNARLFALINVAMADAGILAWEQKYKWDLWRPVVGIREHDLSMGATGVSGTKIDDECDPLWLPLGAPSTNAITMVKPEPRYPSGHAIDVDVKNVTPPFPAYPSGHATFGAAAFHITRLFYGPAKGGAAPNNKANDTLAKGLSFVSEELNGVNADNEGAVRPRHMRNFETGGLWQMIEENGRSRVNLGVHWIFDAFAVDHANQLDLTQNVGGVPLGLAIAEDIFKDKMRAAHGAAPV